MTALLRSEQRIPNVRRIAVAAKQRSSPWPSVEVKRLFALSVIDSVWDDLRIPPANHLEALKGDRQGQYSIRINSQYRICFVFSESGIDQVEIVDYHE